MPRKSKLYLFLVIATIILEFVGIIIMCELTGWRDLPEFTDAEMDMFVVFIISEIVLLVFTFVFAALAGRAAKQATGEAEAPTAYQNALTRRGVIVVIIAAVSAIVISVAGELVAPMVTGLLPLFATLLIGGCALFLILFFVNLFLARSFNKRIADSDKRELQQFVYSQREEAKQKAESLIRRLKTNITATDIYAVMLALVSAVIAFSAGALGLSFTLVFGVIAALGITAALSRVRLAMPKEIFEDGGFVTQDEYPELYRIAEEVKGKLGVAGEVKIAIGYDANASIMRAGDNIAILLGVILLNLLSDEELYAILCHEFGHLLSEDNGSREAHYNDFVTERGIPTLLTPLTEKLFIYPDVVYSFTHMLYQYASTLGVEEAADEMMRRYGNARAAASGLLKINFYDLFLWERGTYDDPTLLEREELQADLLEYQLDLFNRELDRRRDAWCELVRVEILSRSSTHPTLNMRLRALGVTDYPIFPSGGSPEYVRDITRAKEKIEREIFEDRKEGYEDERREGYLEPLEVIEKWKAEGEPLVPEKYRDIIETFRTLGREAEAEALADRAIAELDGAASCYAHFIKGAKLLHRFDEAGIEHLYFAIENNNNYIEEGLFIIGRYCCLAGREDDLETYRARALELQETKLALEEEMNTLNRSDKLVPEKLEGEMMAELVAYIDRIARDRIDEVYIVRKIINEDTFVSPVIVKTKDGISDEDAWEVMHEIFSYLDTSSDWQFSLFSYDGAPMPKIKRIEGSLIWQAEKD